MQQGEGLSEGKKKKANWVYSAHGATGTFGHQVVLPPAFPERLPQGSGLTPPQTNGIDYSRSRSQGFLQAHVPYICNAEIWPNSPQSNCSENCCWFIA